MPTTQNGPENRAAHTINGRTRKMQELAEERSGAERERLRQKADTLDCMFIALAVLAQEVRPLIAQEEVRLTPFEPLP